MQRLTVAAALLAIALGASACSPPAPTSPPAATTPTGSPTPAPTRTRAHGVYPGGRTGEEDDLTPADLHAYEEAAGVRAAWVYFSHNWYAGRTFPTATARWIAAEGAVPWVRLMLRSGPEQDVAEPTYHLKALLAGRFDDDLRAWCGGARDLGGPLVAEWGTEANGAWFSWNGRWNGGARTDGFGDAGVPDGPERFVATFRHIVDLCRAEGATNIQWAWHADASSWPDKRWNRIEAYWPGADWVDVVAVSAYGAQTPTADDRDSLRDLLDPAYPVLAKLADGRPLVLAEFGVTDRNPHVDQAAWARAALTDLLSDRWAELDGFSWWNETWQNDDVAAHDTDMRVQASPELAATFRELLAGNPSVVERLPDGRLQGRH